MVEQGIVAYIQAGLGTPPIAPGGWATELPKDKIGTNPGQFLMAWCYRSEDADPTDVLEGEDGVTDWQFIVDCHGATQANAITLAHAIIVTLRGARGITLPDPDTTFVQAIFRNGLFIDGFSDLNRSFVRTLKFRAIYNSI